jgi:non-canonical poly(A) RNA polymerase PAPD5/7
MRLASRLRNAGLAERRHVQVIAARVSIIKFNSVHGGISIDISLNQTTGLTAITVIKKYLEHFPALRPLILVIKAYLNQRGMNEVYKGGLGSYSIICMAISFLQVGIVSLSSLLILEAFCQMHPKIRLGEIDPAENLGVLLVEFFELYGFYFNYNTIGISINRGGSYFSKMQKGWQDMTKPWLLSIADPTDESASYLTVYFDGS